MAFAQAIDYTPVYRSLITDRSFREYTGPAYASTLMLRSFNTALRRETMERITNTITIGVLGPWAGGKESQTIKS
jgi:hypothetical protein